MDKAQIQELVINCLKEYLEAQEIEADVQADTALFGDDAVIDSMGLVNVIIDIESSLLDEDIEVTLTSEEAMSRRNSPFRTVGTLAAFILETMETE